ncbi:glycoside hydrolase family 13 protein [Leifsonia sp. H3M29-4]|uniref:glycoside hydrolase family 13 protein n=1 Tax=Salinibacterium metalliresistens TaxID=3031321 RepID=UPI0023DB5E41|nr:glycoside hydrolase family 13 protein [Salinibacterium metalliresistens]MDF1478706.1 glycoside hydrolase family 13 protein [Salinibacterium metalliresistens]
MHTPDWLADAVFYQIFPERFANGDPALDPPGVEPWGAEPTRDNFFGGDLAGITGHLDHIVSLGANAIYLTPIFEADTNHRYDAKDYFAIDHRLGDLDAFKAFLDAAHSRGIRVVLDAVLNHCGDGHWAFRDVVEKEAASEYVNWFSVESFPVQPHPEPNYRTCSGCYYLPKWNAYNPEVREHHYKVARYWIEQGVDGWRLDVPYFINDNFWRGFRDVVKGIDENLYIVAEEWRAPEHWLQGDLADGTMNYTLRDLVLGFVADRAIDAQQFAEGMNELTARVPEAARPAMLNLLGSHDTERLVTRLGGDLDAVKLCYALLLMAQGAPMIYYGDEVGLTGDNDPGCRGTMPWDQADWNHDLLTHLRELVALRAEHPSLRRGAQHVASLGDDVAIMTRTAADGEAVTLVVNRSAEPVMLDGGLGRIVYGAGTAMHGAIEVPPTAIVVLARGGRPA